LPAQLCGTRFSGHDDPSPAVLPGRTGWWKFKLVVIDVCNDNKELGSDNVKVDFSKAR
jgi:hypothetical protein